MTIWDNIYKNPQQVGEGNATFSEEILPSFEKFLKQQNFKIKNALDIGCGTGKYLKMLQREGFKTDGIDSSKTAVEMSKKTFDHKSNILCEDMFEFVIPQNKYDLIISISTIHHGTKEQVQSLINKIYEAIVENGKIFITLPNIGDAIEKGYFKDEQKLGNGTYAPTSGPEEGLPHSHYTKEEVRKLFSRFQNLKIDLDNIERRMGRWIIQGSK